MFKFSTCLYLPHVYIFHMFTFYTCLHFTHVYIFRMFTVSTYLHFIASYSYMFKFSTCLYLPHVLHLSHVLHLLATCLHFPHVYIFHVLTSSTCLTWLPSLWLIAITKASIIASTDGGVIGTFNMNYPTHNNPLTST